MGFIRLIGFYWVFRVGCVGPVGFVGLVGVSRL